MEGLITEMVKQVPSLAVLTFLVIKFLRHLCKRDELQKVTNAVIQQNSNALGQVVALLNRINGGGGSPRIEPRKGD